MSGETPRTDDPYAGKTAWWSDKMASHLRDASRFDYGGPRTFRGHPRYELTGGRIVEVTCVTKSPDDHGTGWDDMVKLGTVVRFVGLGS